MDKEILICRLKQKPDLNLCVIEAIDNTTIINYLIDIVLTETSSAKYFCTKIIRLISEQKPELIYPYFDVVFKWLHHENSFIKWDGILTLSNLAAVDSEDKFGAIYQDYFALIHDPQMITAANVIGNAWKIAIAKPELESDITRRMLEAERIVYMYKGEPSPECNCIVCGHVLECFEHYFDISENQTAMIDYAKGQVRSSRKAVAKSAEKFLKRHTPQEM